MTPAKHVVASFHHDRAHAEAKPLQPGTGRHKVLVTSRHTPAGLDAQLVDVQATALT